MRIYCQTRVKISLMLNLRAMLLFAWSLSFLQPCQAVSEVSKVLSSPSFRSATRNLIVNYGGLSCPILRNIYYETDANILFVSCGNSPTNYSYLYRIENYRDPPTIKQINKLEYPYQVNQIIH